MLVHLILINQMDGDGSWQASQYPFAVLSEPLMHDVLPHVIVSWGQG